MSTSINFDATSAFKIQLLTYIESIKYIRNCLDNSKNIIENNMQGAGSIQIISAINSIIDQLQIVSNNINLYISLICRIESFYKNLEKEATSIIVRGVTAK